MAGWGGVAGWCYSRVGWGGRVGWRYGSETK